MTTQKSPSLAAHATALLMPFTMVVFVPTIILWGNAKLADPIWVVFAAVLAAAGLALFIATLRLFILVGKGTLAPWDATRHLVVRGPYKYCRNPMITGVFTILLAESLAFLSSGLLVWAASFFVANTIYFILKEEPDLAKKFGDEYRHYKRHVPRWFPRIKPYDKAA
jgi:protein-S-isoprenylcysteine O-methyltransferase Ste14